MQFFSIRRWFKIQATFFACLGLFTQSNIPAAPGEIVPVFRAMLQPDDLPFSMAVQNDGKLIVGSNAPRLFRLNADGGLDVSFKASALPLVSVCKVQLTVDGKILVNGISSLDNTTRTLIRLTPDGALDTTFNPEFVARGERVLAFAPQPDGSVAYHAIVVQGTKLISSYIKRVRGDGSTDPTFQSVEVENVYDLLNTGDGAILAGGSFTEVNGQPASRLIRLSKDGLLLAASSLTFSASNNFVPLFYSIAEESGGKIVVGGVFDEIAVK